MSIVKMPDTRPVNPERIEKLKQWYSLFRTILEIDEWSDAEKIKKMRELDAILEREVYG
jgi:hypothetical protein